MAIGLNGNPDVGGAPAIGDGVRWQYPYGFRDES
jgi:hypothetical protein